MKIAVSAMGDTLESSLDPRFGRAQYFIIVEPEQAGNAAVINNTSLPAGGAGIATAQLLADKGVEAVITGNVGPNAMKVLKAAGIDIYRGTTATVG
ncbi:MAG TPA: dinitrogenase iron-molybdenum cofactor biosynthesis protein, partial [Firmicutes bacterium]|nr:dinitrogenase iron-molybdenum cofactor biosynthesis protein [Bacillota bacterium]